MITVSDTSAPVFTTIPQDLTVECDGAGNANDLNSWLAGVAATDNCGSVSITDNFTSLSDLCGATGSATVTWTATDACGNSVTASATFTIQDTTAPAFECPQNVTVTVDLGSDHATVTIPVPVASETCGTVTLVNDYTQTDNASGSYPIGTTTVTYVATDACGLTAVCSFTVTVDDLIPPVMSCPDALTVECVSEIPAAYANYAEFAAAGGVATDNDAIKESSFALVSEVSDNNACPEIITRTYYIEDITGSSVTCTQTITVDDQTAPVFADITAFETECSGETLLNDIAAWMDAVSASDNCGQVTITNNFDAASLPENGCGEVTVTFTASDACGNTATAEGLIMIQDKTAPVWAQTMPADVTVACDQVPGDPMVMTATDNCDSNVEVTYNQSLLGGNCPGNFTLVRVWTATDNCGNTVSHTQIISVVDNVPPTWIAEPVDLVLECDGNGNTAAILSWLSSFTGTDACGQAVVTNTYTVGENLAGLPLPLSRSVTFALTDLCGNEITKTVQFTIQDTQAPVFNTNAPALTLECGEAENLQLLQAWLGSVSAADGCDGTIEVTHDVDLNNIDLSCNNAGEIMVTWTAADKDGNTAELTGTLTIQDTRIPNFGEVVDMTVECDGDGNESDWEIFISQFVVDDPEATVVVVKDTTESCGNTYSVKVTMTATDQSNNTSSASATFTIEDTTAPVITCPVVQPSYLASAGACTALLSFTPQVADDCSAVTVKSYVGENEITYPYAFPVGSTVVKSIATDACGNSSECTFQVYVIGPIDAVNDNGSVVGRTGGVAIANVLANDMLNCKPVVASEVTLTKVSDNSNGALKFNADGSVEVMPATKAGTYIITYSICEKANPQNCDQATATVTIQPAQIIANDDDASASPVNGLNGGVAIANVLANDLLNNLPVAMADINLISVTDPNDGVTLNVATGQVTVAPGTPVGTYHITYSICEKLNPNNCDDGIIIVIVGASVIVANNDDAGSVNSYDGSGFVLNALDNDRLNGGPVNTGNVSISVVQQASNPGVYLDTFSGDVYVEFGTPAGVYEILYQICEKLNPNNCSQARILITVEDDCEIVIPNGFSPNNDGIQDLFRVKCIEKFPNASIAIFNRWGNQVYEQDNYGNTDVHGTTDAWWDGSSNQKWTVGGEKLTPGTYFYVLDLRDGSKPLTGFVYLNR